MLTRDRERRQIKQPQRYGFEDIVAYALNIAESIESETVTYWDAVTSKESARWAVAMSEEVESLHNNHTWELVKPPKG